MPVTAPRRLRVAFVADTWDGSRNGGVQSARRFVQAMRRHIDVTVVTSGEPSSAAPDHVVVPAFYLWPFTRIMRENGFPFAWPKGDVLRRVFADCDVVHVQFPFPIGMRAVGVARRMGKPIVTGFHVQPENVLYNLGIHSPAATRWVYGLFRRTVYEKSQVVVCPTAFAERELVRYGYRLPMEVVSNGIAPEFLAGDGARPARLPRHEGRLLLLAVGRLAPEKRLDVVLEGVRRCRNASRVQLVVTGRGPEEEHVRELAAGLPVPAEVGYVSDEELRQLMRTADLMIHASEVELEGMAVMEAMGGGLPALIANAPFSASTVFAASPDFLFRPGDPDDLARKIDALVEAPEKIAEARRTCLARAPLYAFDESVQRMVGIYERVAAAGVTPPRA